MKLTPLNAVLAPFLALLTACAATAPAAPAARTQVPADTVRKTTATTPADDLTKYRPVFAMPTVPAAAPTAPAPSASGLTAAQLKAAAPVPANYANAQLDQRLRDQAFTNQNVKYAQGYRIRAYLGVDRDQVMGIPRQVIGRYPDETDYIIFKQPMYRLYIGDYLTKLDAARGLVRVRQFAPKAELEAMQVLLNKVP